MTSGRDAAVMFDTKRRDEIGRLSAALQKIFGISEICPSLSLEDEGFDKLSEEIIRQMDRSLADKRKTFKVNCTALRHSE